MSERRKVCGTGLAHMYRKKKGEVEETAHTHDELSFHPKREGREEEEESVYACMEAERRS